MKAYDQARTGASLRARNLRRASTDSEKRLWRALRETLPAYKWRRQMPIGPYIVDLACFAERLVIELDGGQHTPETDAARSRFVRAQGYRIIRFWNNDVLANTGGVIDAISLSLGRGKERRRPREGEVDPLSDQISSSPSQPAAGSLPLPMGEGTTGAI